MNLSCPNPGGAVALREGMTRAARARARRSRPDAVALIPVKRLAEAKSRLSGVLDADARARLQLAMLADTLSRLAAPGGPRRLVVVTADPEAAALARSADAEVLADPAGGGGLNAALAEGLAHLRQGKRAGQTGPVVLLPADLPFLDAAEVVFGLGRARRRGRAQVVPDRHGTGTNALFLPEPAGWTARFGAGSFARHRATGDALALASLACDIDRPADLDLALAGCQPTARPRLPPGETAIFLRAWRHTGCQAA